MAQEEKDLLIKDLSMRLPYGIIGQCEIDASYDTSFDTIFQTHKFNAVVYGLKSDLLCVTPLIEDEVEQEFAIEEVADGINILDFKPYLFPLSSMTDEMWDKEFRGYGITEFTRDSFKYGCETLEFNSNNPDLSNTVKFINQLIKNHFDINGLIPMGLANDATGLNIY
jgi:hypothetical protein